MIISYQSLEILLDLIEIKVNSLQVEDRDDVRELTRLKKCRQELLSGINQMTLKRTDDLLSPSSIQPEGVEHSC